MRSQSGSAISETLIGLLILIPAFWAVDWLGRLHDMQRSAIASARYLAWEELTGNQQSASSWRQAEERFGGSDLVGLVNVATLANEGPSINTLWNGSGSHRNLLPAEDSSPAASNNSRTQKRLPTAGYATAALAHGDRVPSAARLGGLSGQMLGLPRETLGQAEFQVRATALWDPVDPDRTLIFSETAGLSTHAWQANTDREYQQRTEDLVASEPVDWISAPAQQLGRFFVFKEGRYAASTDFIPPSRLAPR